MTARSSLQLSPFYWDLRNRVTRPWDCVGQLVSKYFWRRWKPILGPEYTMLIIELRLQAAELDASSSGAPVVQVSHQDLADRTGLSLRKIQRLLSPSTMRRPENWFLGKFLRVESRYVYDEALKKKIRVANTYAVAIDDPLHPEDEEAIGMQVAQREQQDLQAQGLEPPLPRPEPATEPPLPSTMPPATVDEERLYQRAREMVPDLSLSVLARLFSTVGPDTISRQLDWFPQRDNRWARNGPAAAFFTYCKEDRPPPEPVRREARASQQDAQALEEARAQTVAAAPAPLQDQPDVWRRVLEHLPTASRYSIGSRLEFIGQGPGFVRCRCPSKGDAWLIRQNQAVWNDAATAALGTPTVVVFESDHDEETSTCAP